MEERAADENDEEDEEDEEETVSDFGCAMSNSQIPNGFLDSRRSEHAIATSTHQPK